MSESEHNDVAKYIKWDDITQKWIPAPIEIIGTTFEAKYSGAEGVAYVNTYYSRLVKLILYRGSLDDNEYKDAFKAKCTREAEYQIIAARHELAPSVYSYGFIDNTTDSPFPGSSYFFIFMEYLSPLKWEIVFADDITLQACKFIRDLVEKTHLYNSIDPRAHFYKNITTGQLKMIDYGRIEECIPPTRTNIEQCIKKMEKALEINCSSTTGGKYRKYSYKTNNKNNKNKKKQSKTLRKKYLSKKHKKTRRKR